MGFDILKASKNITDKYVTYLKTMFDISDNDYKKLFEEEFTKMGSFSNGPYLEVIDSFESGSSIDELISEGILNKDFKYIDDIYSRTLYKHQETAVRKLAKGKNIVVSTGTGSGKTESFLIPILNSLMEEKKEKGFISPGVRALIIYPMNALANDQISRLRNLLENYKDITFGAYTGQTDYNEEEALIKYSRLNDNKQPNDNELISREKMIDSPPHILITNYSMLEYLMIRPKEKYFFTGEYASEWKYIVLDEAHIYSGSTGIEVSMLISRLKAYINNPELRFILTSATLGDDKMNKEVVGFAENLCGQEFFEEDVIRANRVNYTLKDSEELTLNLEQYKKIEGIIESSLNDEEILEKLKDFIDINILVKDYKEYIFELLLRETNFWKIKNELKSPISVIDLCKKYDLNQEELSTFVNVASRALKNRKKLFDSRYHMFIRATDGVFITLGKKKELSLTRKEKTIIDNEEYKFYEITTCSQCHDIYIMGYIRDDHLLQKTNFDVDNIQEAFWLGEHYHDEDEDNTLKNNKQEVETYELCPHCGFIRKKNQVNPIRCEHKESEYIRITQVKKSDNSGRVTKCISCEGSNNIGILRSFFSGQEASTSVVATALFEELPVKSLEINIQHDIVDNDYFDDDSDDIEPFVNKYILNRSKQFICFSDSRQAAAFFASYLNKSYKELLYSRIVYNNIQKSKFARINISDFVLEMSTDFEENEIYDLLEVEDSENNISRLKYIKEAWKAILRELITLNSRKSLIGLGLIDVVFDDNFKESINFKPISKFDISAEEMEDIFLVWIKSLLKDNAIYHNQKNFTDNDLEFFTYNNFSSKYFIKDAPDNFSRSFIPKKTNSRFDYLKRVLKSKVDNWDDEDDLNKVTREIMIASYNKYISKCLSELTDRSSKVDIKRFAIKKSDKIFRCNKCKRIYQQNVNNVCPSYKCDGWLYEIDKDELKDNHYYRIYNNLDINNLRVVEHTAQLSREKAYDYQEKFKKQELDVLSCSTTFEMGVDIGDLETVFMRNMPPTPANYIQRAGRAGRALTSAAFALTFCNRSNHDFNYFNNPIGMISGSIKPPLFKKDNQKIAIRHIYATALSFFWKKYEDYFGDASKFFGGEEESDGIEQFKEYLYSKPEDLRDFLLKAFPNFKETFMLKDFGWVKYLFGEEESAFPNLKLVYDEYRNELNQLYEEIDSYTKKDRKKYKKYINGLDYRTDNFEKERLISFLSRKNILPKYGFPVDTVELLLLENEDNKYIIPKDLDLSRDLSMAISEYAPGCEIVAGGKLIKSRYIKKAVGKGWKEYRYVKCENCNSINVEQNLISHNIERCGICDLEFKTSDQKVFIVPEFGFITDGNIRIPSLIKPERTYRSEALMVNKGNEIFNESYQLGNIKINVTRMEDGEIAILNTSNFYVCDECGYAMSDKELNSYVLPFTKRKHDKKPGKTCPNEKLSKVSLGYRFKTDALYLSFDKSYTYEEAFTILQGLILGICEALNIEQREIAGCLYYSQRGYDSNSYDFVIYDTTPGGAGHVNRVNSEEQIAEIINKVYEKAINCKCGGEEGDTSCYECFRTYRNQSNHDIIKRKYIIDSFKNAYKQEVYNSSESNYNIDVKFFYTNAKDIKGKTFEEIFVDIIDDEDLRGKIINNLESSFVRTPDYVDIDIELDGIKNYIDIFWEKEKVMLINNDNLELYDKLVSSQYNCYLLNNDLDFEAMIRNLK